MVFGGLEAGEGPSKNEIRSEPLLGYVCFWFLLVFRLYMAPLFCSSVFPSLCSSCAEIGYINNIFC
jgi:hypothetical protein